MTWRTVIVGLGWVARTVWLPRLRADGRFVVVGVVEPDPLLAADLDPPARWPDVADVPAGAADLAVIAVPNHLHAACAAAALRAGMSVFVEKPLCTTRAELDELAALADAVGGHVISGSAARLRADVRALAELVADGRLGHPVTLDLSWVRARGIPRPGSWFTNRKLAGGGALIDLGWHLLEVGLELLGWPAVERSAGVASSSFLENLAWRADWRMDAGGVALPLDVEDTFSGFLAVDGGVGLAIRAAWASHEPVDVTTLTVHGDRAVATLRTTFGFSPNRVLEPELVVHERGEVTRRPVPSEPLGREYDRLLDLVDDVLAGRARPEGHEPRAVLDAVTGLYAAAGAVAP